MNFRTTKRSGHQLTFGRDNGPQAKITVTEAAGGALSYSVTVPPSNKEQADELTALASDIIGGLPDRGTMGFMLECFRSVMTRLMGEAQG
jgi:hypothetical protein